MARITDHSNISLAVDCGHKEAVEKYVHVARPVNLLKILRGRLRETVIF